MILALAGAAAAVVGSNALGRSTNDIAIPVAATVPATPAPAHLTTTTAPTSSLAYRTYAIGDCVTWDQAQDTANTQVVDCAKPHLIEIMGTVSLARWNHYPTSVEAHHLLAVDCQQVVRRKLGHKLALGDDTLGDIYPQTSAWDQGDRTVWCGVVQSPLGILDTPFTGRVR